MRGLLPQLVIRVLAAGMLTIVLAAGYVLFETADKAREDVDVTAHRVAVAIDARPDFVGLAFGGVAPTPVFQDWQAFPTWTLIAPGVCVEFGSTSQATHRRCGPYVLSDKAVPEWFVAIATTIGLVPEPITVPVRSRTAKDGRVTAFADRDIIVSRAWERTGDLMRVAVGMAVGGALLTGLLVARLLMPFRAILAGIERLQRGDFAWRLPRFRVTEFDRLGVALGDTATTLKEARDSRAELTRRLFTVQENERRALARELHDEFGQCLTATRALAAAIVHAGGETSREGRRIGEITAEMMESLNAELSRLRPPDLDELGLRPALERLTDGWRARAQGVRFKLRFDGRTDDIPDELALSLYRIAQECLTNAIRHGHPSTVSLTVAADSEVVLTVIDDGSPAGRSRPITDGHGLLGIRERVDALGGSFVLDPIDGGMRAITRLPLAPAPTG
ncbi:Sensor histidine kinase LiaS [Hartmannibacter diazotrophicus]|uniref:Sensor histidine kinase LiaS n=1 Tax=Hartmannibacter diazotrophicus TaxID=1482074 RepID=A0A2C9D511_9HYPH|nr:ATP-binding protein [Hartmannibacter diazotrophicus]SON55376.1 Sensor histidine kinase LiaS [Hartmannibacter diazotrophicus]